MALSGLFQLCDLDIASGKYATTLAECSLLRNYIDAGIRSQRLLPEIFDAFALHLHNIDKPYFAFDVVGISKIASTFLILLESTPSLYGDVYAGICTRSRSLVAGGVFSPDNQDVLSSFTDFIADFVSVANEKCDISLTQTQMSDVSRIISVALPVHFVARHDCRALSSSVIEQAIASANDASSATQAALRLVLEIDRLLGFNTLIFVPLYNRILNFLADHPQPVTLSTAREMRDEFVLVVHGFCGVAPLNSSWLAADAAPLNSSWIAQLDYIFLEDLMSRTGPSWA